MSLSQYKDHAYVCNVKVEPLDLDPASPNTSALALASPDTLAKLRDDFRNLELAPTPANPDTSALAAIAELREEIRKLEKRVEDLEIGEIVN